MGRITIYLDDASEARVAAPAEAPHILNRKWVATLIQEKLSGEWSTVVTQLAGAWSDFPDLETLRQIKDAHTAR